MPINKFYWLYKKKTILAYVTVNVVAYSTQIDPTFSVISSVSIL